MNTELDRQGFAVARALACEATVLELREAIERQLPSCPGPGVRGLAQRVPRVREFACSSPVRTLVDSVLGPHARMVRSILFSKSDESNWHVAWHQDLAIAVQRRVEIAGFTSWSLKDGVPHVQPPIEILERMLTVRLHLDEADENNGALWVSPGSHRLGRLPAKEAAEAAEHGGTCLCSMDAGDALLMRPLLMHSSRKATSHRQRRVIHLEFAGVSLPQGLEWAEPE